MIKKALIFGGSGFVGTHIAKHLLAQGVKVSIADIKKPSVEHDNLDFFICDVRNPITFSLDVDRVYNVAAVHVTPGHEDYEYFDTNVLGALHVTEFCQKQGIHQLVFTSSISVYGPGESEKNETSEVQPISAYGRSKYMAECIHQQWLFQHAKHKLVVVRPAVVFGEGECGNYFRLAKALKKRIFFYPGRKNTKKACIYVKELVRTMDFAFEQLARQDIRHYLYNGCIDPTPTLENVCIAFHESAGLPIPWIVLPTPIAKILTLPFLLVNFLRIKRNSIRPERIDKLVHSTNIVCQQLQKDGYLFEWSLVSAIEDWQQETSIDGVTRIGS